MRQALNLALLLALALPAQATAQTRIGTAAAANQEIAGTPPGAERRVLLIGSEVVRDERIATSPTGSGQILFGDQTTLTVAPNSDLVLDRYVYDPDRQEGEMALTLGRGVMRFIGGRISKRSEVGIRTPTATIGIRGALATIDSRDDTTQLCLLAGEYARITGRTGDPVVLARAGVCAVVEGGIARFSGALTAEMIAELYALLEGRGNGGRQAPVTDAPITRIAQTNSGLPGGPVTEEISTAGERRTPPPTPDPGPVVRDIVAPGLVTPVVLVADEDDGLPDGGAATNLDGEVLLPFTDVAQGSLIGTDVEGNTVTIPVPGSGGIESPIDTARIQTTLAAGEVTAVALGGAGTGLFGFGTQAGEPVGTHSLFGTLNGVGFIDPVANFTYFEAQDVDGETEGLFGFFGDATGFQGQFADPAQGYTVGGATVFPADITGLPIGPATVALPAGTDLAGTANTLQGWLVQPNLFGGFDVSPGQTPLFMIGDAGLPRFDIDAVAAPVNGDARWLIARLQVANSPGGQISILSAAVDRVGATGSGGPILDGAIFTSSVVANAAAFSRSPVGTAEDQAGNTLFGPGGQYLVLSSFTRGGAVGAGDPLVSAPGEVRELRFNPATVAMIDSSFSLQGFSNLAAHDPALDAVLADPLPLAGLAPGGPAFTGGFASGIARCSDGICGLFGEIERFAHYALRSTDAGDVQFAFTPLGNGLTGSLALTQQDGEGFFGNFTGAATPGTVLTLDFGNAGSGAAIDDSRFAGQADREAADVFTLTPAGAAGPALSGSFAGVHASAGLVGSGGVLPEDVVASGLDTPRFLRWGHWSAEFTLTGPGADPQIRTDFVHLGNFVTGIRPDPADILPGAGVTAMYSGLAIGTRYDVAAGTTQLVGGSFALTYDFGANSGTLDLQVPASAIDTQVPVNATDFAQYAGTRNIDDVSGIAVNGGFFSDGAGNPVAATAGSFDHADSETLIRTLGVYGGDAVPPGSL